MKITLTARALHALVKPVLSLAATDIQLPVLNAVLIEYRGGHLVATATDRFRIGVCRRPHEAAESLEFRALVKLADVKRILSLFKPQRGTDSELSLTVENGRIYAEATGGLGFDFSAMRVGYELMDAEFPAVNRMIRDALANEPTKSQVGLNAAFLADWHHAGDTVEVKIVGPDKPVVIRADNHFLGLLMPRRLVAGDGAPADDWTTFLADTEPAVKKAAAKKPAAKRAAKKAVA